jgi:hypothetical protein
MVLELQKKFKIVLRYISSSSHTGFSMKGIMTLMIKLIGM